MLKKISLSLIILLSACSTSNIVPKAINKPQKLQLGDVKKNAPIQNVEREMVEGVYVPYKGSEPIRKLFDFSKMTHSEPAAVEKKPVVEYTAYEEEVFSTNDVISEEEDKEVEKDDGILRIAVMLPTQKQNAVVAQDLKNAATMALFDAKSNNSILQFYSTDGTYDSAKEKTVKAVNEDADVIVGPLFADEVRGASKASGRTPIISFTTDTNVLDSSVFSIGFLMEQQIKRVVEYAIQNGKTKFGIIVSDSESGDFIRKNLKKYISMYNGEVIKEVSYTGKKTGLMNAVKEISDFDNRVKEYNEYKKQAKDRFDYLVRLRDENPEEYKTAFDNSQYLSTNDEVSFLEKTLEELEHKTTISDPEYESIFIFGDDINDVLMIGSSLMYYDIHPDRIKYLGTSQFENPKIYSERAFRGAWYPSVSTKYTGRFDEAYKKYFNRSPVKIASLAYDAVSLINSLAVDGMIERRDLLNPNGWTGINGIFRFKSDGSSERNMDIKEVVGGSITKTKIISPAPVNFLQ
ncbi:MAG: penicillin-binding protein activator [Alphaproteobacteria bacterium]|nr:penicillin-binding protein activator [Alphaproteobacteria bacterium]